MKRVSKRYRPVPTHSRLSARGCFFAVLLAMACLLAAPVWAGQHHRLTNQEEGAQTPQYSTAPVTIQKKSLKHVFAYGRMFAVNPETVIVGTDGKEVSLKKMLVPCDAEVMYIMENGRPTAKRINIKRVAANASWQWTSERPE